MIVIKCPSCHCKQFITHDECDNLELIECRNCRSTIRNQLVHISVQNLEPPHVEEWWDQLSCEDQGAILERAVVLPHRPRGYSEHEAWVATMKEWLKHDKALHLFEPKQDDDFVRAG